MISHFLLIFFESLQVVQDEMSIHFQHLVKMRKLEKKIKHLKNKFIFEF